ncbi:hypothetical protein [Exiguobacterium sp. s102]|uniref:hypothetical protein n=1 Tax=Exiguobacterium sp. s102 TaxID=2751212 RepID=UPI001BE79A62|nr:hypothetical protein [Exiguobacterium sp. s102]
MPSDAYYDLLYMLDMDEVYKGNKLHIEIFKRVGQELKLFNHSSWKHPNYKEPTTQEELLAELDELIKG